MKRVWTWLGALGSAFVLADGTHAAPPVAMQPPVVQASVAGSPANRDMPTLLDRLNQLGEQISRDPQSPQSWRHELEQSNLLLQIAAHFKGQERDGWLKMAVDSRRSAAVQAPENEPSAYQQLVQMAAQLAAEFPDSHIASYAARQEIQADYMRCLRRHPEDPNQARDHLRRRLVSFAQDNPTVPEAPEALMEGAQLSEELGKPNDARRVYRYVTEHYAGQALARKAGGALSRLGLDGEAIHLELPLLYPAYDRDDEHFNMDQVHGKLTVVYFWSSAEPQTADDFETLKHLTDHYQYRGLAVVYVNLDKDTEAARAYLSGRLLVGTHVYQKEGLDGAIAERYGIQTLPQAFLVGPDGTLIHSLKGAQIEAEVSSRMERR